MRANMATKMTAVLLLTIFNVIYCVQGSPSQVPVFIWNENKVSSLPYSGNTITKDTFANEYLERLTNDPDHNLLVFLQDKLSLDDISKHADVYSQDSDGAVYHNLKSLMENGDGMHLPSVSEAADAVEQLKEKLADSVKEVKDGPYSLQGLELPKQGGNTVLVHLPETDFSEDRESSLKNIDGIIGSMSEEMKKLGKPYTALYTGKASSPTPSERLYFGRHLLEEPAVVTIPTLYNITDCLFFYATSMSFSIAPDKTASNISSWALPGELDTTGSSCANDTAVLKLTSPPVGILKAFSVIFNFGMQKNGWWGVNNDTQITFTVDQAEDVYVDAMFITAPLGSSYHCTNAPGMKEKGAANRTDDKNLQANLTIFGLQVQAFKIVGNKFGTPNDCVGFFTIGIWSGLVTVFLLTTILAFGLMMLMNINTMDRFDDPKGKTITVNVAE